MLGSARQALAPEQVVLGPATAEVTRGLYLVPP